MALQSQGIDGEDREPVKDLTEWYGRAKPHRTNVMNWSKLMRLPAIRAISCALLIFLATAISGQAQDAPKVHKVEPPSWWAGSSLNPVRLMLREKASRARVGVATPGLRVVKAAVSNERGTCLFVDVAIAPQASPGVRELRITTLKGTASAKFEVLPSLRRVGRFRDSQRMM